MKATKITKKSSKKNNKLKIVTAKIDYVDKVPEVKIEPLRERTIQCIWLSKDNEKCRADMRKCIALDVTVSECNCRVYHKHILEKKFHGGEY